MPEVATVPALLQPDVASVRRAIDEGQLVLHYQPIQDVRSGDVVIIEALVRWEHPDHGLLLPGAFLPAIAGTPVSRTLGRWVLERAAADLARINRAQAAGVRVSVNVDATELDDPEFARSVFATLSRHGVPPGQLILELTETAPVLRHDRVEQAELLASAGVTLAIDDLGTGYSSLEVLDRLPIGLLKIDGGFVRRLGLESHGEAIVGALVHLAQELSADVVAEWVETIEQSDCLSRRGVFLQQGWLHGRPMALESLVGRVLARPTGGGATAKPMATPPACASWLDPIDFQDVLRTLRRVTQQSMAFLSVLEQGEAQWIAAARGLAPCQVQAEDSFCRYTVGGVGVFEVIDARADPRFAQTAHVVGPPHVRFYAGAPVVVDGHVMGALAVAGHVPHELTAGQRRCLLALAAEAASVATRTRRRAAAVTPRS